jgi:imidazole glycerol-phosphate synthase subunit HisH
MIVIVDYGLGNLRSIENMLCRAGVEAAISSSPDVLRAASKLILPGVGYFRFGMESLHKLGLVDVLNERVLDAHVPILGICLGAQLLGRRSEEGDCSGLSWVPMDTVRFDMSRIKQGGKVPHMGWSDTRHTGCALFKGMSQIPRFYYVHSYHFRCDDQDMVMCTAEHGYRFASGVASGNILGVQFHPEKSHVYGQQLLKNFASIEFSRIGAS